MNSTENNSKVLLRTLPFVLFFILSTFYLLKFTSYIFYYQEKASLFLVSFDYLAQHLKQPGGFLVYLGNLQTTFYYYPIIGALFISFQLIVLMFLVKQIGLKLANRKFYFLPFIIGSALFFLQTNLEYTAFNTLGIVLLLFLFNLVIRYLRGRKAWLLVVLFPVVYLLFGSFSYFFFTIVGIYLLQNRQWKILASTAFVGGILFIVAKEFLFHQNTETLYLFPFEPDKIGGQTQLFFFIVILLALLPLLFQLKLEFISAIRIKKIQLVKITPFVIIAVLVFISSSKIDKKNADFFHIEKMYVNGEYEALIEFNTKYPSTNVLSMFSNNVALAETGKLSESLFSFTQSPDGQTLFMRWSIAGAILKRGSIFYYSLGMINEAQRWAYENWIMHGNSPETLKMLIKTDLIKGKYKVAEKYILILEQSIFYRKEAEEYRKLLFNDAAIAAHSELGKKLKLDTKHDFFVKAEDPMKNVDLILKADPSNKVAIEYKLAWLMLQKNMQGVVDMLPVIENASYKRIPKNVEEAVVTYKMLGVGILPELDRLQISGKTEVMFNEFNRILQQYRGNKQQAQAELARNFSDTYWYYVFYN